MRETVPRASDAPPFSSKCHAGRRPRALVHLILLVIETRIHQGALLNPVPRFNENQLSIFFPTGVNHLSIVLGLSPNGDTNARKLKVQEVAIACLSDKVNEAQFWYPLGNAHIYITAGRVWSPNSQVDTILGLN